MKVRIYFSSPQIKRNNAYVEGRGLANTINNLGDTIETIMHKNDTDKYSIEITKINFYK